MRPITDAIPKPLIPFFCATPLAISVAKCLAAGIENIAVNTHHLAEAIESRISRFKTSIPILHSHESEILGTGGAFVPLARWREQSPVLIYNGDVVCGVNLNDLMKQHRANLPVATMVLTPYSQPGKTPVWVSAGRVVRIGGEMPSAECTPHTFTGIHIVSETLLQQTAGRAGYYEIIDNYRICLENNMNVMSYVYDGPWFDLGEPSSYLAAHAQGFSRPQDLAAWLDNLSVPAAMRLESLNCTSECSLIIEQHGSAWVARHRESVLKRGANVVNWLVLGEGSVIDGQAHLDSSVLLNNVILASGETFRSAIVYHNAEGHRQSLTVSDA